MKRSFRDALAHRRTYYAIKRESPVSDEQIEYVLKFALRHVPSAFNSQTTRMVLLLGHNHDRLWEIVLQELKRIVPPDAFEATLKKVTGSFASGYGTVLFFEDQSIVESLQQSFPAYADKFPQWSQHTSGMHQLAVWTMLEDLGFGASLQHYNPLIDEHVHKQWALPDTWHLIAQMPFGIPTAEPGEKQHKPIEERLLIFR